MVYTTLPQGGFVILDVTLTPELLAEGYTRDVIRAVQDARKEAGLDIADRIALNVAVPADKLDSLRQFEQLLASETLATSVTLGEADELTITVAKA